MLAVRRLPERKVPLLRVRDAARAAGSEETRVSQGEEEAMLFDERIEEALEALWETLEEGGRPIPANGLMARWC